MRSFIVHGGHIASGTGILESQVSFGLEVGMQGRKERQTPDSSVQRRHLGATAQVPDQGFYNWEGRHSSANEPWVLTYLPLGTGLWGVRRSF